jgi:hypothetical protein
VVKINLCVLYVGEKSSREESGKTGNGTLGYGIGVRVTFYKVRW